MTAKTILGAIALSLAPMLALAECGSMVRPTVTAMTCAEGQVYDSQTQTCVAQPTS